jgi:hypothetical protein
MPASFAGSRNVARALELRHPMSTPDWKAAREQIIEEAKAAIEDFTERQANEVVSYFGFDATPSYGSVLISIDTLHNSLRVAKESNRQFLKTWRPQSRSDWQSHTLRWFSKAWAGPLSTEFGSFSFIGYREIEFPEWGKYLETAEPNGENPRADSPEEYLEAQVSRVLFQSLDALVKSKAFKNFNLAEWAAVGFVTHDSTPITTHVLRWPDL